MASPKIDPELHQAKKPEWIKVRLPSNPVFFSTKALVADLKLHTCLLYTSPSPRD